MQKINLFKILETSTKYREKEYIDFFFHDIANIALKENPIVVTDKLDSKFSISIVKDRTSRLEKSGKLMERAWRNCIFYYIDKETYIKYFGTNASYPEYEIEDDKIVYTGLQKYSRNVKRPTEPRTCWQVTKGLQI